jgi:hypothetical protein
VIPERPSATTSAPRSSCMAQRASGSARATPRHLPGSAAARSGRVLGRSLLRHQRCVHSEMWIKSAPPRAIARPGGCRRDPSRARCRSPRARSARRS